MEKSTLLIIGCSEADCRAIRLCFEQEYTVQVLAEAALPTGPAPALMIAACGTGDPAAYLQSLRTDTALVSVPVLVLVDDAAARERALQAGADEVLLRPLTPTVLRRRVRSVCCTAASTAAPAGSAALANNILAQVAVGIFVARFIDGVPTLIGANPALCRMMGFAADRAVGLSGDAVYRLVHPEDIGLLRTALADLLTERRACEAVYRSRNFLTGQYSWLLLRGHSHPDEDGSVLAYLSYTDITRQMELDEQLRESEASLRAAVRHTGLYYWEYDIKTGILRIGERMRETFGLPPQLENFPESWLAMGYLHPEDVAYYRSQIALLCSGTPYLEWELRVRTTPESSYCWRRIYCSALTGADGRPARLVATAQDIHDIKELEANFLNTELQNGIVAWQLDLKTHCMYPLMGTSHHFFARRRNKVERVPETLIAEGLVAPESVATLRRMFHRIYAGEQQVRGELRCRTDPRAEFTWNNMVFTVVDSGTGTATRALCTSRDISVEKHLEQLYRDEQAYREDLGSSLLFNCQINLTAGTVEALYANGKNELTPERRTLIDFRARLGLFVEHFTLSEADNEALSVPGLLRAYAAGQQELHRSMLAVRRDTGRTVWLETDVHLLHRPETGDLIAFIYNHDHTGRYLTDSISASVLYADYDYVGLLFADTGDVRLLSDTAAYSALPARYRNDYDSVILGHTAPRLRADASGAAGTPDAAALLTAAVAEHLQGAPVYTVEFDLAGEDGAVRRKRWRFSRGLDAGVYCLTRSDVEDIVQAERAKQEELTRAVRAAEKANAAKSDFLARMSHELRTPLNGVIGLTQLARTETDPAVIREDLEKIGVSGRHLETLVNDILDMSKVESGEVELHPVPYAYEEFIRTIGAVAGPLCAQKNIRFVDEFRPLRIPLYVDKVRFNQIFFNFLSNSVKFTPENGEIRFYGGSRREGDLILVDYYLRDTGIGMSSEFQKRMFEPFSQESSRVTAATQGTGLGLSIAKAFIELMGGRLAVESAPGQGTTFHVHLALPPAPEAAPAPAPAAIPAPEADFSGKTILVVEDHPLNRKIAVRLLEKKHAAVRTAENGRQAVELFAAAAPGSIDAVLMDIRMPVMDGLEAARAIRALDHPDAKTVPILAMTANAYDEDRRRSAAAGMNCHLTKPIDAAVLYEALQRFLPPG